mmetsp:Transcript_38071/g.99852  ORF Transcript_38071/g.99852 Transcript_38071/m.99852 type:complete len:300 (-) Transcript_38071:186-1085(-)
MRARPRVARLARCAAAARSTAWATDPATPRKQCSVLVCRRASDRRGRRISLARRQTTRHSPLSPLRTSRTPCSSACHKNPRRLWRAVAGRFAWHGSATSEREREHVSGSCTFRHHHLDLLAATDVEEQDIARAGPLGHDHLKHGRRRACRAGQLRSTREVGARRTCARRAARRRACRCLALAHHAFPPRRLRLRQAVVVGVVASALTDQGAHCGQRLDQVLQQRLEAFEVLARLPPRVRDRQEVALQRFVLLQPQRSAARRRGLRLRLDRTREGGARVRVQQHRAHCLRELTPRVQPPV